MAEQSKVEADVIPWELELGRRLCAAYISYQLGISIGYAYKTHTSPETIGPYWRALASAVTADITEAANKLHAQRESLKPEGMIQ